MKREESSLDKVKPIRPGVGQDAHKQQFLDYVSLIYDEFRQAGGFRPAIMLFTFVDEEGDATTNYLVPEDEKHKASLFVGRALTSSISQVSQWDIDA